MNKEIKFRGKRIDNGEWVCGGYAENDGKAFIVVRTRYIPDTRDWDTVEYYENNPCYRLTMIDVEPDTVGQYIGVNDKNGKEIYEGDIVKRKMFDDCVVGQVVRIDIGFCGFMLKCGNRYYHMGKSEHTGISDCDEVIGNVYENADLLKEAGNE